MPYHPWYQIALQLYGKLSLKIYTNDSGAETKKKNKPNCKEKSRTFQSAIKLEDSLTFNNQLLFRRFFLLHTFSFNLPNYPKRYYYILYVHETYLYACKRIYIYICIRNFNTKTHAYLASDLVKNSQAWKAVDVRRQVGINEVSFLVYHQLVTHFWGVSSLEN